MIKKLNRLTVLAALFIVSTALAGELPQGPGLAARYTGDAGIDTNEAVVFVEDFEEASLEDLFARWNDVSNEKDEVISFARDVPEGSEGEKSLQMAAHRSINTGGHLFKVFTPGYDQLYIRFYTKFAADHGFTHHFVRIRGMINPVQWPVGNVSKQPSTQWCGTDIEPLGAQFQLNQPAVQPPGIWALSSYWPEMRSWQGEGGTSFYPNLFEYKDPVAVGRDRWICVETMVKMNSSPDSSDGEQAFWIDGRLVARLAPGTPEGTWLKDKFHISGRYNTNPQPFEGFRWRQDMQLQWNRLWLLYYQSDKAFQETDEYASQNPDSTVDTRKSTVWFDHIVVAREYIGPMGPCDEIDTGMRGDFNQDGRLAITDVIKLILLQFESPDDPALDFNSDGRTNITDAIDLIRHMFQGA
ncbi:MAG: hypothetical protein U9P14_06330 [Gemmatimonadota bacterium]|nr:hypothetical protein [Gemmatimonadota bacterium]